MKRSLLLCSVSFLLSGCAEGNQSDSSDVEAFFQKQIGGSPDYYIATNSPVVGIDRVAVVYGLSNDRDFCEDLATAYNRMKNTNAYFCERAN